MREKETSMLMTRIASLVSAIALGLTLMIPLTALVRAHVATAQSTTAASAPVQPDSRVLPDSR